jgi:hypothetical protein
VENAETGLPDDTDAPARRSSARRPRNRRLVVRRHEPGRSPTAVPRPIWKSAASSRSGKRLYADAGQIVRFQIGGVTLEEQIARCIVPMRSATTGLVDWQFKLFMEHRRNASGMGRAARLRPLLPSRRQHATVSGIWRRATERRRQCGSWAYSRHNRYAAISTFRVQPHHALPKTACNAPSQLFGTEPPALAGAGVKVSKVSHRDV